MQGRRSPRSLGYMHFLFFKRPVGAAIESIFMAPLQGAKSGKEVLATYGCVGYAALAIGYFITPLQGFLRLRRYFITPFNG
jgi:hypothetical protein